MRSPLGVALPWLAPSDAVFQSVWMTVLSFEALLFTISIAFILLAMAKERSELRHKAAALVDPLTGIANRRAFLTDAEERLKWQAANPRPVAVMLLDLDHFKSINDRFGHAAGDGVLRLFAQIWSRSMRRTDLFGRLGGEEFAALVYDTTAERAFAVAEEIRTTFAAARSEAEGRPVEATASIGVVISPDAALDLAALLAQTDHALYRAKNNGRNRTELAAAEPVPDRIMRPTADRAAAAAVAAGSVVANSAMATSAA